MHGIVISNEPKFAAVLCSVVESSGRNSSTWEQDWNNGDSEPAHQSDLLILHVNEYASSQAAKIHISGIRKIRPSLPIVVIGNTLSMQEKVDFLKLGVVECLDRPVNLQRLYLIVRTAGFNRNPGTTRQHATNVKAEAGHLAQLHQQQVKLKEQIDKLASVDVNVLITGETGVGKTWWSKRIHEQSRHRNQPFVCINCGAIPESLIESELFGHRKGSFTNADSDRIGRLAFAGEGTVLLDELDALPLAAQVKLLHAVEDRVFQPVGSNERLEVKARILAATNQSLDDLVEQGRFRSDLYFRLNVYEINIPSLRDRRAEILPLAKLFASEFSHRNGRSGLAISDEVAGLFQNHDWPGNLRELRNCIEHAAINCDQNVIQLRDLPTRMVADQSARPECVQPGMTLDSTSEMSKSPKSVQENSSTLTNPEADSGWVREKDIVAQLLRALQLCDYNRTRAAAQLGISRAALYKMLSRYQLC